MKKLIIANWKMNLGFKMSLSLAKAIKDLRTNNAVVVCPSAFALPAAKEILQGSQVKLGAQDCSGAANGAHTGQISAASLKEIGCAYVILGHSEQRAMGETCRQVNLKITAALRAGLTPIICVGETWPKHQAGQSQSFVGGQIRRALTGVKLGQQALIVAYEPLWAIGSGKSAKPEEAGKIQAFIKQAVRQALGRPQASVAVLYGGSVDAKNAAGFLKQAAIEGLLVGGASLRAQEFKKIANIK